MNNKPKYKKPVVADVGSLTPVYGADCLSGNGAIGGDCGSGYENSTVSACDGGQSANYCDPAGNSAVRGCWTGSGPL